MERGFEYLVDQHGIDGARGIFENVCVSLFQDIYGESCKSVQPSQGDGGIDVLIGDLPTPEKVYQCKFFLGRLGDSQKSQIRQSFKTVSEKYNITEWFLCLPIILTEKELLWWSKWKNEKQLDTNIKIELCDGSYLINKLKKTGIYTDVFDDDIRINLEKILEELTNEQKKVFDRIIYGIEDFPDIDEEYNDSIFVKMLESAGIDFIDDCKVEFFNAEISRQQSVSKDEIAGLKTYNNLKKTVYSIWQTQYREYRDSVNGNKLLNKTYLRIEDLESTTLSFSSSEYNLLSKKGLLHQLADERKIGWIEHYLIKLTEYMEINK